MKNKTEKMQLFPFDEVVNDVIGKIGTQRRDHLEEKIDAELLRKTIKENRKKQKLTQAQLGKKVGMDKARICKIENSNANTGYFTIAKIFRALNLRISSTVQ